jgi:hypothetical protein
MIRYYANISFLIPVACGHDTGLWCQSRLWVDVDDVALPAAKTTSAPGRAKRCDFGAGERRTDPPWHSTIALSERSAATSRAQAKPPMPGGNARYVRADANLEEVTGQGGKEGLLPRGPRVRAARVPLGTARPTPSPGNDLPFWE